jgi:hypothetical protein
MDSEPILKKTLVTVGAMVGAWVAFVGTVSLIAVVVTSHVVGASGDANASETSGSTVTIPAPGVRALKSDPLHPASQAQPNPNRRAHDSI